MLPFFFSSGEFFLNIPCWFHFYMGSFLTHPVLFFVLFLFFALNLGSFSYTTRAGFIFRCGVSLTHPMRALFLSGEFHLHFPCWLDFYLGSFSYTSRAGLIFIWGVSVTLPVLSFFSFGEFLLHIPCWLFILFLFFYFIFYFLTHPVLASFPSGEFPLHISRAAHIFIWGVSLTRPMLGFFIIFFIFINLGNFSYISHTGFIFEN